jgi:NADPH:quinone reductase-like Zn-dependent oxidoreductase
MPVLAHGANDPARPNRHADRRIFCTGHVFGPVAGILRAVVVNGLVRERLRLIPHEQKREQLLTLTGLIEAGKLTPVLDRTYPLADTAEGLRRVEQGHARG